MTGKEMTAGTRGSKLALWQTEWVVNSLKRVAPDYRIDVQKITTTGDRILDTPLPQLGGKGIFTKELDRALLAGDIDFAVHSLKDLPTVFPEGLRIAAITSRWDPRDALVGKPGTTLAGLPRGATLATGSLRRSAQILHHRPDIRLVDIRGNVDTRLRKLDNSEWDGIVLAVAGLERLGFAERITERLATEIMLPAVGQGCFGIVTRENDPKLSKILGKLNDAPSAIAARAERALLNRLDGGCHVPIGALGMVDRAGLVLHASITGSDGVHQLRRMHGGSLDQPEETGRTLAELLLKAGGEKILADCKPIEHAS